MLSRCGARLGSATASRRDFPRKACGRWAAISDATVPIIASARPMTCAWSGPRPLTGRAIPQGGDLAPLRIGYSASPIAHDSFTRIHGIGCGSSALGPEHETRGRLTIPIRPSVEATPTLAIAQKSAMISEIHRSKSRQAAAARRVAALLRVERRAERLDEAEERRRLMARLVDERGGDTEPDHPLPRDADDAAGLSPPPGSLVLARRIAPPRPACR